MKLTVLALVLSLLAVAVVLADPDLPGHVSPTETLEKNSLFIPMDRKTQGYLLKYGYKPNGSAQNNTFNMRAYALSSSVLFSAGTVFSQSQLPNSLFFYRYVLSWRVSGRRSACKLGRWLMPAGAPIESVPPLFAPSSFSIYYIFISNGCALVPCA